MAVVYCILNMIILVGLSNIVVSYCGCLTRSVLEQVLKYKRENVDISF